MSIILSSISKQKLLRSLTILPNYGKVNNSGLLRIGTEGMSIILADLNLENPAFNNPDNVFITSCDIKSSIALNTGIAAEFQILDRDREIIFSGIIDNEDNDGELLLKNNEIVKGKIVEVNLLKIDFSDIV